MRATRQTDRQMQRLMELIEDNKTNMPDGVYKDLIEAYGKSRHEAPENKIWYAVKIQDYSMDVEDDMPCFHRVTREHLAWTMESLEDSDLFKECYVSGFNSGDGAGQLHLEKNGGTVFEYNGQYIVAPPESLMCFKKLAMGSL